MSKVAIEIRCPLSFTSHFFSSPDEINAFLKNEICTKFLQPLISNFHVPAAAVDPFLPRQTVVLHNKRDDYGVDNGANNGTAWLA